MMKRHLVVLFSLIYLSSSLGQTVTLLHAGQGRDCLEKGSRYAGTHSYTRGGVRCQRWDARTPHVPRRAPFDGADHNYCRNPDNDTVGPWCYTTDPDLRWDYCNISICPDDSLVLWTDTKNSSANILAMEVNYEGGRQAHVTSLNVSVLADSGHVHSDYVDVTGSYLEKTIFYADRTSNCVVMTNLAMNMTSNHLFGVSANIKSMAYDWIRQNLYWIDDVMNTVMVVDPTLTFYTSVYRTNQGTPRALALHASQKKLFISLYKPLLSCVIRMDLAGKNPKVVFRFPQIFDVTSVTLDHTDDRLYMADYWGHGSLVVSSDMNGASIRRHYFRRGSKFMGISAYMDYIYVTDSLGRYNNNGNYVHSMWLKSKRGLKTFRYNFDGEPRGMKILSSKEEHSFDAALESGDCMSMPPCDHICLPQDDMVRECVCSAGYVKSGDTGCVIIPNSDNFFLTIDHSQQILYQYPNEPNRNVAKVDLDNHPEISIVASDPINSRFWLANSAASSIDQYTLEGRMTSSVPVSSKPCSLEVDVITGNVFFADAISQSIYVISSSGRAVREVVASEASISPDIKMIALDLRSKKIYWTDTNQALWRGEVWRADMAGGNKERVLGGLHWPHAITIDYQRNSLFVSEAMRMQVHEVSLSLLVNLTDHESITSITHDLPDGTARRSARDNYVTDIAVHNETLYFLSAHQIKQLNMATSVVEDFCAPDFYHLTSLALFDSRYLRRFTDNFANPCLKTTCPLICLPTSPSSFMC